MARVSKIIRKGNISQVAPVVRSGSGSAWGALAEIAKQGASFVESAAMDEAREAGLQGSYRDEEGKLQVEKRSPLGGPLADAFNTAAQAKYLSQRSLDIGETLTELALQYENDPAGFKRVAEEYVGGIRGEEGTPSELTESLAVQAEREA